MDELREDDDLSTSGAGAKKRDRDPYRDMLPLPFDAAPDRGGESAPLVDDEARRIAREEVDRSLLVEAGAGTGKTTLLVDRVLHVIARKGVPIEKIVAITFTEKAAAELRLRVRERLEAADAKQEGPWSTEERRRFKTALNDFQLASIQTIHGFCAALLRERPVEAGVDPGFMVLDGVSETLLFDEVWQRWEAEQLTAASLPLSRALWAGVSRANLRDRAWKALGRREVFADVSFADPTPFDIPRALGEYAAAIADLDAFAEGSCLFRDDRFIQLFKPTARRAAAASLAPPGERETMLIQIEPPKLGNAGNKKSWKTGGKDEAHARFGRLKDRYKEIGARIAADFGVLLVDFIAAHRDEKERRGVLDFHDLLMRARDLLRDQPKVRDEFLERIGALLVDEFQDTDPLQMEIAFLLAESRAAANTWNETEIAPGRLFIVGDPKQSIYRFRRADIDMYDAAKMRIAEPDRLRIEQNFRSVPGITQWVNKSFEVLFAKSDDAESQAPFAPIEAFRKPLGAAPPVVLLAPPSDAPERSAEEVRLIEAGAIASAIERVIDSGWALPRQIAILFRSMTALEPYEDALEAREVPFQVDGGRAFFERSEVQALLACLASIDDPEDPIALVAALKSPHFGVSDDALARFVTTGGALRYLTDAAAEHAEIVAAFEELRALHGRRHDKPLHRVVEDVLESTQVLELHALRGGGRRAVANLRKVAEKARALEAAGVVTLRGLIRTLEAQSETVGAAEGDSPIADETADFVRLMTIHGAKGLEFGVVVLANLFGGKPFFESFLADGARGQIEFTLGRQDSYVKTRGYEALRDIEKLRWRAEERRLLYVGATRARDMLILPGHGVLHARGKGGVMAAFEENNSTHLFQDLQRVLPERAFWRDGESVDGVHVWVMPDDARSGDASADGGRGRSTRAAEALLDASAWRAAHEKALARGSEPLPVLSARHAARTEDSDEASEPANPFAAAREAAARERALTLGSFVHAVLETLPRLDAAHLVECADALPRVIEDATAREEALGIVRAALELPVLTRARRAPRLLREVPFSVVIEGRLAEGRVDLVFEEEDGLVFVDYKTDRVEPALRGTQEALRAFARERGHEQQAAVYARALAAATGRPVREGHLVYARGPASLALEAADLASVPLNASDVARLGEIGALDD
jgi:ATP-dependent helicase/nuclease subunit A